MHTNLDEKRGWKPLLVDLTNFEQNVTEEEAGELNKWDEKKASGEFFDYTVVFSTRPLILDCLERRPITKAGEPTRSTESTGVPSTVTVVGELTEEEISR